MTLKESYTAIAVYYLYWYLYLLYKVVKGIAFFKQKPQSLKKTQGNL